MRRAALLATAGLIGLGLAGTASAYTVAQDGLEMTVTATPTGQSVDFTVVADFTNATTSWIGDTMDSFSLQFGNVGNGASDIASFTASITGLPGTDSSGTWTGYKDKVSGTGCSGSTSAAICYTVNPTASGNDNASIIAAQSYFWKFNVTFAAGFDVASMLAASNSIKFLSVKTINCPGGPNADPNEVCWTTGDQLSQSGTFTTDDDNQGDDDNQVPEPGTLALLGLGLMGLGAVRRRKA